MDDTKVTRGAPAKRRGTAVPADPRASLLEHGVTEEQADSLVGLVGCIRHVLQERRKRLRGGQTLQAQRQALVTMRAALDAMIEAMPRLNDQSGLGMALRTRLDAVSGKDAGEQIQQLLDSAHTLRAIVRVAQNKLPNQQTRDRAPTGPIRLIHERTGLKPSTSETSTFHKVTLTLYEAAGFPHENPDAAIRAYQRLAREPLTRQPAAAG